MGWIQDLGGAFVDIVTDVIPGGNLIEAGVKAVGGLIFGGGGGGGGGTPVIDVPSYELGSMTNFGAGSTAGIQPVSLGGLPAVATAQTQMMQQSAAPGGLLPWWRGPGGKMQFPWDDPQVPTFLKQFALDDAYLRPCVRAPRGFVVIRDKSGRPYAIQRDVAVKMGIWKPATKPLLTSTEVRALRTAARLQKKIKGINKKFGEKVKVVHRDAPKKKR